MGIVSVGTLTAVPHHLAYQPTDRPTNQSTQPPRLPPQGYRHTNETLREAVGMLEGDPAQARAIYGPVEYYNTSGVTDMSTLFAKFDIFNADISR